MPFGIVGRTGPGMRQVVRFGDLCTGRGTFGGEFGARHCNQWGLTFERRGPLFPKLLWADLLLLIILPSNQLGVHSYYMQRVTEKPYHADTLLFLLLNQQYPRTVGEFKMLLK